MSMHIFRGVVRLVGLMAGVMLSVASHGFGQVGQPAEADTVASYEIDEVVSTATRTFRKIIDIPYSVQRIDNRQYKYDRKVNVSDVLGTVPGVFLESRYGNHDVRISIRGFGSRSNSGIRGVRILLDGIPESEPDGQTRIEAIDFQSIGSIEVVKGNASSLYTNAPGGVINFINDIGFQRSFASTFNEFGSFGLRRNGIKAGVRTEDYGFLLTYSNHSAKGHRDHANDYWHILNTVLETTPGEKSKLSLFGYYVDGLIKLPGSLTPSQFARDPFQANTRDIGRDSKRITQKGRLGVQFRLFLDEDRMTEVEATGYGTIKYFERTARTYRIINRSGLGTNVRLAHRYFLFDRLHEFSVGGDALYQTGPVGEYPNFSGTRGDSPINLSNEAIGNTGAYLQLSFNLIPNTLDVLMTGRYDRVLFKPSDMILAVRDTSRVFSDFTPKIALNYKLTPTIAAYTSYGVSFDSPAGNELGNYPTSSSPNKNLNPDLHPQKSRNFELGIKGNIARMESLFGFISFEGTFFNIIIDDEIVPFEVFGDVYFRNSAKTKRTGLELGAQVDIYGGLRLRTAYTLSRFSYRSYTARTIEVDGMGNFVTRDRDFTGNSVPSVPRHNLLLVLSYEHRLGRDVTGFIKTGYRHTSGMFADDQNTVRSPEYNLGNISGGVDMLFGAVNVLISGGLNNIFNRTYVAFVNTNSANREFFEAGEPRHFFAGVNIGYAFQ